MKKAPQSSASAHQRRESGWVLDVLARILASSLSAGECRRRINAPWTTSWQVAQEDDRQITGSFWTDRIPERPGSPEVNSLVVAGTTGRQPPRASATRRDL